MAAAPSSAVRAAAPPTALGRKATAVRGGKSAAPPAESASARLHSGRRRGIASAETATAEPTATATVFIPSRRALVQQRWVNPNRLRSVVPLRLAITSRSAVRGALYGSGSGIELRRRHIGLHAASIPASTAEALPSAGLWGSRLRWRLPVIGRLRRGHRSGFSPAKPSPISPARQLRRRIRPICALPPALGPNRGGIAHTAPSLRIWRRRLTC